MRPCGRQPPAATLTHDPPPGVRLGTLTSEPFLLRRRPGEGLLRALRCCAWVEGAPREGHDFPRLGEGASAAFGMGTRPPWKASHAVGEGRGGVSQGSRTRHSCACPPPSHGPPFGAVEGLPISVSPTPAETKTWTAPHWPSQSSPPPLYLRPQVHTGRTGFQVRVGRGREGGPLLPPSRALPSPGRLRSRWCPFTAMLEPPPPSRPGPRSPR